MNEEKSIMQAYRLARQRFENLGVDCGKAVKRLDSFPVSIQCWQGDDVGGFENSAGLDGSGIMATGGYPGRARNGDELRADMDKALSMIPGNHRVNLHAIYAETGGKKIERNALASKHFSRWIDWAKERKLGLDFNPTFFAHPRASDGFTLSSRNESNRRFWIEHGQACRKIGEHMGKSLGKACVVNIWIPDGYKDTPADRLTPRQILHESLDSVLSEKLPKAHVLDAVESKLFGIGSESYVVGSHEFYLGYAAKKGVLLCLDSGHFHPTEAIGDKISSTLCSVPGLLLHISRGVRWDSDHVVTLNDDVLLIAQEIVRSGLAKKIHIGLDFFDASINRIAAWVIGTRNVQKAILAALLEPYETLRGFEREGNFTARLAFLEEMRAMPVGAVWDYYCMTHNAPVGIAWLDETKKYEKDVLSQRK